MYLALLMMLPVTQTLASSLNDTEHESLASDWSDWSTVGTAQLSMLFFDIYESELKTPTGVYEMGSDITPHPLALSITYQRDISQSQLLNATEEQWRKLGYSTPDVVSWINKLSAIFPNIEEGHNLTYVTDGEVGHFIYSSDSVRRQVIGEIEEETLNDAFLAIWLSPKTDYPSLRQNLIGADK